MSNRALRRLEQSRKKDTDRPLEINEVVADDNVKADNPGLETDDGNFDFKTDGIVDETQTNRFNLLLEDDTGNSDLDNNHNKLDSDGQELPDKRQTENSPSKNKRKNKRKKKLKQVTNNTEENVEDFDELLDEWAGKDVMSIAEVPTLIQTDSVAQQRATKAILSVEHKYLNSENELRRIFGSRVVRAESGQRHQRKSRTLRLAQPKSTWPPLTKTGLSMSARETHGSCQYFAFEHNQQYQKIQHQFLDAVESMNPQNVMGVMRLYPYHIDTLLQMSDLTRLSEDMPMAADLIERSLYAQENAFHPLFSLSLGNSRLSYKFPENRSFMITLFRHITFVGLKGCYRTALEFCKLLLSLNPEEDPLGVLLILDFYALLSQEYTFLISLFQQWEINRNLSQLPNFAFSVCLAMYKQGSESGEPTTKADLMLQNSLLMFPHVLLPLLDKCSVRPDSAVAGHDFFTDCLTKRDEPVAIKQLCNLYVGRCFSCWKDVDVMNWLETNVKVVIDLVDRDDSRIMTYKERRMTRYRGAPMNVYRHILMSDVKGSLTDLPPEIASLSVRNYDPLPPRDSVVTYTRAPRRTRLQQDNRYLAAFFRSLLPTFTADEPAGEEGAAGGERRSLQQGVEALMTAMRDLLRNIQPVPPPVENDEHEERDEEEWD